jgi:ABC-type antimicrobial peptide transport system permease subunit
MNAGARALEHMDASDASLIFEAVRETGIHASRIIRRTHPVGQVKLYFTGESLNLKYLDGIDEDEEADYLADLAWTGAGYGKLESDGIYISTPIANKLGVVSGDNVVIEVRTKYGRRNTGNFIVKGIIHDTSIFGFYKVYASRTTLNKLLEYEDDDCSTVGIDLARRGDAVKAQAALYNYLKERTDAVSFSDRETMRRSKSWNWNGVRLFVLTVSTYLSEVAQLLDAISALSVILYALMLLIIYVSAAVTYRLILHERTRELGTMRAIGFYGRDIRLVLAFETVFLVTLALVVGFLLAMAVNWFLSGLSFSWIPSFEMFMSKGRVRPLYLPQTLALNACIVYISLMVAVYLPSRTVTKQGLPLMLSGGAKG